MKKLLALIATLSIAACGEIGGPLTPIDEKPRLGAGDIADVATTQIGLWSGFTEAHPVLAQCGSAAAVCALVGKPALKYALVETGVATPREANISIESIGWWASGHNLMVIAGASTPAAAAVGTGFLVAYLAQEGVIPPHQPK